MDSTKYSRKDFIKVLGLGTASLAWGGWNGTGTARYCAPIAFQLYSVRREIEKDFDATIHALADMGFEGVETYALPAHLTLSHAAKVFKECGLSVISMHTELPVGNQRESIMQSAEAYQCDHIIYAGWPQGKDIKILMRSKKRWSYTMNLLRFSNHEDYASAFIIIGGNLKWLTVYIHIITY